MKALDRKGGLHSMLAARRTASTFDQWLAFANGGAHFFDRVNYIGHNFVIRCLKALMNQAILVRSSVSR